jgi:hypothetical protein
MNRKNTVHPADAEHLLDLSVQSANGEFAAVTYDL